MATLAAGLRRLSAPFRTPAYRWLAVVLCFSNFAAGIWLVSLVWEVIRLGGGPSQLSLVATFSALGLLLPALLAGVVADRLPRRTIIGAVGITQVLVFGGVAALSAVDLNRVWVLAAATFVIGTAQAFLYPAYTAILPSLLPARDLMSVNGFEGMVRPVLAQAIGPAVAGIVVGSLNPASAITIAAAAELISLLAVWFVPSVPVERAASEAPTHPVRGALRDMRQGYDYMVHTPWVLATLLFASLMLLMVIGPIEVLIPFLVKDALDGGPSDHALVLAAFGIGSAIGAMVMAAIRMPRRYLTAMIVMWGVGSLPLAGMGLANDLAMVVAMAFVLGVLFSAPQVIWGTLLQRRVPPKLMGRISSLDFFVSMSLMPVSMALAGPLSQLIGLKAIFVIGGVVPPFLALLTIWLFRLRRDELDNPVEDDPADQLPEPAEQAGH